MADGSSSATVAAATSERQLVRGLGPLDATSLVVGGIIGSGIFISPAIVARQVGAPGMSLLVWIVAGVIATCGALCYAELSAALPRTGGTYVFLQRAYRRPILGFLFCWAMFFASRSPAIAAVATVFAEYAGYFLGSLLDYGTLGRRTVAITVIAFLTAVNLVSVGWGGKVQTVATALKVAALLGIVGTGLVVGGLGAEQFRPLVPEVQPAGGLVAAFGLALIPALFAYNGWTYSSFVGGEVRNPQRNLPLSVILGIAIVLVVYLLVNVVYIYVLPFEELQRTTRPAADTMQTLVGPVGAGLIAVAVMVSTFGTVNAMLLIAPRAYYAIARDGLFFPKLEQVHPRFHTPARAIVVQGVVAATFAVSGTFEQILGYFAFIDYLFFTMAVAAVMVLRRTEPGLPRPYRVWGYPITPLLFLGVCVWYLGNTLVYRFGASMVGVLITLTGVPFYFYWSRRMRVVGR